MRNLTQFRHKFFTVAVLRCTITSSGAHQPMTSSPVRRTRRWTLHYNAEMFIQLFMCTVIVCECLATKIYKNRLGLPTFKKIFYRRWSWSDRATCCRCCSGSRSGGTSRSWPSSSRRRTPDPRTGGISTSLRTEPETFRCRPGRRILPWQRCRTCQLRLLKLTGA